MENEIKMEKGKKGDTKIGAVIILIISAAVFLPTGGAAVYQALLNNQKAESFGSYDGKQILYEPGSKFHTTVSSIAQNYRNSGLEVNEQSHYYIMNQAFKQTINSMAFSSAVEKTGYKAPEDTVNRLLVKQFTGPDGVFSKKIYNQTSSAVISEIKKDIKNNIVYTRYVTDMCGTNGDGDFKGHHLYGLKTSSKETEFIAKMGAEKHSFDAVSYNTADFPMEETMKFAREHADKFTKYNLEVITLSTEEEAKSLLKQINANEITFKDAVTEKSQKYYSNAEGVLTSPYKYQISETLGENSQDKLDAVLSLSKDSLSDVIQTAKGFSIFKGAGESQAPDFESEDIKNICDEYVKSSEKSLIENYYTEKAEAFATEASIPTSSFDKACKKLGLEKTEINAFPINYGNTGFFESLANESIISSLVRNADAYKKAFALKLGEVSSPIVLDGKVIVLKCTGTQTSEETDTAAIETAIPAIDQTSGQKTLMNSEKVVDNFFTTYLNLMNNNNRR